MNKHQFKLAFINYCQEGGHGYDPWDIAVNWESYCENPEKYEYLQDFLEKEE